MESSDQNIIKIAICDDHELARMGIEGMLSKASHQQVVASVETAEELLQILENTEIDVVLQDYFLSGMDGITAASLIRKKYPAVRILMLSSDVSQQTVESALEAGVDGFISKKTNASDLMLAVESVSAGLHYYGRDIAGIIGYISVAESRVLGSVNFTPREKEIISMCCAGLISKEIAARMDISLRTVENHKAHIFRKLGINNSVELVRYAVKHGLLDFK